METATKPSISTYKNIKLDKSSLYELESLDEIVFLTHFFHQLQSVLKSKFDDYIFYLYARSFSDILPESLEIISSKRKVLIFLSNENYEKIDSKFPGDYYAIFKCYFPFDKFKERVFPFPLGYVNKTVHQEVKDILKRNITVFFAGNLNENRIPLYKALSGSYVPAKFYEFYLKVLKRKPQFANLIKRDFSYKFPSSYLLFTNGFKKGLNAVEYSNKLYDSQIVLCPKGFHVSETFRHYEAMRAGCVIISEKLPNTYLYRNSPIIQVSNWLEGLEFAKKLLADSELLKSYHEKVLHWWKTVCNEHSTALYVSNILNSLEKDN